MSFQIHALPAEPFKSLFGMSGQELGEAISRMFEDRSVDYLHLHNARPGCFAARVTR